MPISEEAAKELKEAQDKMMVKCRWCKQWIYYMELTREGLCPECAEKVRKETIEKGG